MLRDPARLLDSLRQVHERMRERVVQAREQQPIEQLTEVVAEQSGDAIYAIDRVSEQALLEYFEPLARDWPSVLIAEGLGEDGVAVLPHGCAADDAELRVLVDPIDGTRGLMYDKRSAWILTGVAPNRGNHTTLADIELALQTEIPLVKQHLCDTLWAIAGKGAAGDRYDRLADKHQKLQLRPSAASTIAHGFGTVCRFFPGARAELAAIDDALIEELLGKPPVGAPLVFEDQYISAGGQLYELIMGHDRWIADLRPLLAPLLRDRGEAMSACAHPYDLASELVAREANVIVTDPGGQPLAAPLDVTSNVAWVGFANLALAGSVGPALRHILAEHRISF